MPAVPTLKSESVLTVTSAVTKCQLSLHSESASPLNSGDLPAARKRKSSPGPLIASALSEECEIQYVVLKNISIIIKAYPKILQDQVTCAFSAALCERQQHPGGGRWFPSDNRYRNILRGCAE